MTIDKRIAFAACLALGALPGTAWADFTVTFKNPLGEDVHIVPGDHNCIHHPNNFKTVIPAGKHISIEAEWQDICSQGDPDANIDVCVDYKGETTGCVTIQYKDENKYVEVKQGPVGWPYLAFP